MGLFCLHFSNDANHLRSHQLFLNSMGVSVSVVMPGATNTSDQEAELRYQIRRQAHHPAIIGWCGSSLSFRIFHHDDL